MSVSTVMAVIGNTHHLSIYLSINLSQSLLLSQPVYMCLIRVSLYLHLPQCQFQYLYGQRAGKVPVPGGRGQEGGRGRGRVRERQTVCPCQAPLSRSFSLCRLQSHTKRRGEEIEGRGKGEDGGEIRSQIGEE